MISTSNRIISIILFLLLFLSTNIKAQNLPYVDEKRVHFGFSLGFNFMDFATTPAKVSDDVSVTSLTPGFTVGAISDLRLSRYLNLRFTPSLNLGQRTLQYADSSSVEVLSIPLYLPLYLKYSAERNGNFRPYVLAGGGIWWDWGRNIDKPVLLKKYDALLEAGVGCDIYFSFFKLSPELKFSVGLNDMLVPLSQRDEVITSGQNSQYTNALSKLTTKMITLSFNFE